MFHGIGVPGVLLLLIIALLLFGPKKLPELGRAFGHTLREFKAGARDIMGDDEVSQRKEAPPVVDADKSGQPSSVLSTSNSEQQRRLPE